MNYAEALQGADYKKEVSTSGEFPILEAVAKATFTDFKEWEDKGFGPSLSAQFIVSEVIAGQDFALEKKVSEFFNTSPDKIGSKTNGLAKLLNGFFSVGVDVSVDENFINNLNDVRGTEVYLNLFKKKKMKKNDDGTFSEVEGEYKQGLSFMTEKNAIKKAERIKKESGAPF